MKEKEFSHKDAPSVVQPFVVGLGASAGGLQALIDFFEHLGEEAAHICYLVVQHIKRDVPSKLAFILQQHTRLKVKQAEEGDSLLAGTVLVLPPNKEMTLNGNLIRLQDRPYDTQVNKGIDILFASLAAEVGPKAIGIIFSGTGTDGLKGVKRIEANNGIVLVQEPATAQFGGLPSHIIHHDHPDQVLSPSEMSHYINAYVSTRWEMLKS